MEHVELCRGGGGLVNFCVEGVSMVNFEWGCRAAA